MSVSLQRWIYINQSQYTFLLQFPRLRSCYLWREWKLLPGILKYFVTAIINSFFKKSDSGLSLSMIFLVGCYCEKKALLIKIRHFYSFSSLVHLWYFNIIVFYRITLVPFQLVFFPHLIYLPNYKPLKWNPCLPTLHIPKHLLSSECLTQRSCAISVS